MNLPAGCEARCPGCSHRARPADESEQEKVRALSRWLAPWALRLGPLRAVQEARRWGYRERSLLHAEWRQGRWALGMLKRLPSGREFELIEIPGCPVHAPAVRERARMIGGLLRIGPPEIELFAAVFNGEFVSFVLKQRELGPRARQALEDLGRELGTGLWLNLHPSAGKRVMSAKPWIPLGAAAQAMDAEGFAYGPASFRQALPELHRASLEEASEFLRPGVDDDVVDLYCGLGKSLALWRERGARAIGVELSSAAVELARQNAPGAAALVGKVDERIPQLAAWRQAGRRSLLYTNPSRTGMDPITLAWVTDELRPERIAYLSCDPRSLARDLGILESDGYRVSRLTPYDFFPQTAHVETLALLDRGGVR